MSSSRQIFPHEIVSFTAEHHFQRYNTHSKNIYLIVLLFLVAAFISLYFIKVDVSVSSTGIIRSVNERSDIRMPVEGRIDSLFVRENMHVTAGQVLLKIRSHVVDEESLLLTSQETEIQQQLSDLQRLVSGASGGLQSKLYRQQYMLYQQKLSDINVRLALTRKSYDRYAKLFKERVVAAAEFERYEYDKRTVENELQLARQTQLSQWQGDLTSLQLQMDQLKAKSNIYTQEKDFYTIKAPATGYVQQLKGIQAGTFVAANEVLGEISPDSGLIAEAYVLPKDIGLVQPGTPVNMQVDAYNYNEWGLLSGKVSSISSDVFTDNAQPYFKIRCQLDSHTLQLKNGYKGQVKKGMTIQAHFRVAKRSIYQLLYDRTDKWLNPKLVSDEATVKN